MYELSRGSKAVNSPPLNRHCSFPHYSSPFLIFFFQAILQISHLSFVPFHYTSSLSATSFFYCSLPKTTLLPLWLHLLPFWVCFYIFYCCLSRAEFASSVHSAVCREKQRNKIFSVYWHESPPSHLWSFALKSLKTFCFEPLLWKRKERIRGRNSEETCQLQRSVTSHFYSL